MAKHLSQIIFPDTTSTPPRTPSLRPVISPPAINPTAPVMVTGAPTPFPSPTAAVSPVLSPAASSSSINSTEGSTTSAIIITNTPTPAPTAPPALPTPTPGNLIQSTYNAIRAPFASLLRNPSTTFPYNSSSISGKTASSLFIVSVILIVASLFFSRFMKNSIGRYWYFFLVLGIILLVGVLYLSNSLPNQTRSFSSYTLLSSSWQKYKERFIKKDGRVIDENGVTTSEAQSYALLQSVWADDMATFNQVWNWTQRNLKRPGDALFGWRYGSRPDNTLGFLPNGGDNSASDADSDIAFALIMASRRWHNGSYRASALPILGSMWDTEVATVSGQPYLTAGNWASSSAEVVINPSYFSPYEWRVFAQEDRQHDWMGLIAPAYDLLTRAGQAPLDKSGGVGLPPDWLRLTRDGQILPTNLPNLNSDYSFDATRIPWRVALDYQLYGDKRALEYLQTLSFLTDQYQSGKKLYESYTHDGHPLNNGESPVMYATSLGIFMNVKPELATQIYQDKILNLYSTDSNSFRQNLSYYEENWLWFGSALYLKALYKF